jgi:uncharacterized repeat protein (TIGR01451 family)
VATDIPARQSEIINEVTVEAAGGLRVTAQARSFVRQPRLALDKRATLEAGPGDVVSYTLTVENWGQAPAYDLVIADPIPEYIEGATSISGEVRADEVRLTIATLPAGETATLTWQGRVATDLPGTVSEIVNEATVGDSAGNEAGARAVTRLGQPDPPLLTKAASYEVYPGGPVVYTITLRNPGGATLYDVVVADPIPEYVLYPTAVSGGGQVGNNTTVLWRLPAVAPGETATLTWQGQVATDIPVRESEIVNEVVLEAAGGLRVTAQARSLVRRPELALDKTATLEAGPGERIEYTIQVANHGRAPATNVELRDPIPAHLERATSPDGEVRADAVVWRFETLPPGAVETVSWSAFVAESVPGGVARIVNEAAVTDGAGQQVEAVAETNLRLPPAPVILKDASYQVDPGGPVVYTITLRNAGDSVLYDVTVTDPIPTYVINPANLSAGGRIEGNTAVVWELAGLAPGETVSLGWQGEVARDIPARETEIINEATVETAGGHEARARAVSFVRRPRPAIAKAATLEAGPGEPDRVHHPGGQPGGRPGLRGGSDRSHSGLPGRGQRPRRRGAGRRGRLAL